MSQATLFSLLVIGACFAVGQCQHMYEKILCNQTDCACTPPKNTSDVSEVVTATYLMKEDCLCLCGKQHYEVCKNDGDCVDGFFCSGDHHGLKGQETKVCACPCDDVDTPFCPSYFSRCSMDGRDAHCYCAIDYNCKQNYYIPMCVVWGDDTVYEYRNPCFFAKETCGSTKYDTPWRIFPKSCRDIPQIWLSQTGSYDYQHKIKYMLSGSAIALIDWDLSISGKPILGGFYPEPEPEAEAEAEPVSGYVGSGLSV